MNRWITLGGCWVGLAVGPIGAAEAPFSRAVPPAEFAAAGLTKLTPEEVARLDALVREYKSGALERARREAAAAESRAAAAEAKAARAAAEKKDEPGFLERARVLVAPGTQVDVAAVESRIAGEFRGWEVRTVLVLENGQRWQVTGGEPYVTPPIPGPAVKISPGAFGSFWMTIEGVRPRVKVTRVDVGR